MRSKMIWVATGILILLLIAGVFYWYQASQSPTNVGAHYAKSLFNSLPLGNTDSMGCSALANAYGSDLQGYLFVSSKQQCLGYVTEVIATSTNIYQDSIINLATKEKFLECNVNTSAGQYFCTDENNVQVWNVFPLSVVWNPLQQLSQ